MVLFSYYLSEIAFEIANKCHLLRDEGLCSLVWRCISKDYLPSFTRLILQCISVRYLQHLSVSIKSTGSMAITPWAYFIVKMVCVSQVQASDIITEKEC